VSTALTDGAVQLGEEGAAVDVDGTPVLVGLSRSSPDFQEMICSCEMIFV